MVKCCQLLISFGDANIANPLKPFEINGFFRSDETSQLPDWKNLVQPGVPLVPKTLLCKRQ
jgi:hypothetical protein